MVFFCLLAATLLGSNLSSAQGMVLISGQPATTAAVGEPYHFQPAAFGSGGLGFSLGGAVGGGARYFTITNLPSWASFSPITGELNGTPGASDVGTYSNIVIAVTNGVSQASLPSFSITVSASGSGTAGPVIPSQPGSQPGSITLSWMPPSENTDGSRLTDLAGYKIYSGIAQANLAPRVTLKNPGLTRYVVESLAPGEQYFAITAINSKGIESDLSDVAHAASVPDPVQVPAPAPMPVPAPIPIPIRGLNPLHYLMHP